MKKHLLEYIDKAKTHSVRGLRILVEYFHALEIVEPVRRADIPIVSVFGSARLKRGHKEYETAKKLGRLLYENGFAVVTGASQGIMEAANEGVVEGMVAEFKKQKEFRKTPVARIRKSRAFEKKLAHYSLGLKISLPFEPHSNPHLGVVATFHYFMIRKFFFATLSSAFVACEGGWGTRDELYEMLTLVQTGKMELMPIIYISSHPKHIKDDLKFAVDNRYISPEDLSLIQIVSDYKEAVDIIKRFYRHVKAISYEKKRHVEIFLKEPLSAAQKKRLTGLVAHKYRQTFPGGIRFFKNKLELRNFQYRSYGVLRQFIDEI